MLKRSTNATINLHCEVVTAAEIALFAIVKGWDVWKINGDDKRIFVIHVLEMGGGGLVDRSWRIAEIVSKSRAPKPTSPNATPL